MSRLGTKEGASQACVLQNTRGKYGSTRRPKGILKADIEHVVKDNYVSQAERVSCSNPVLCDSAEARVGLLERAHPSKRQPPRCLHRTYPEFVGYQHSQLRSPRYCSKAARVIATRLPTYRYGSLSM